jgi:outer membrane protein insertion porin family
VRVEEKPAVRQIVLSGNDELSKDDFKDVLDLKPFSILDQSAVKRNVKKIQDKYIEKGFFLAEVSSRIDKTDNPQEVDVVFVINEHAKVMVKDINFVGVSKVEPDVLKAVMATREGGYLSFLTSEGTYREEIFQRDLQVIHAAYLDRGFIAARVDKPIVTLSPDKRFISITIKIDEGEPYRIGKLDFSGDLLDEKDRLKARLASKEGEWFNRSLIARDIQTLTDRYYDAGYAYANINPVTAVNADAKTIDLSFDVQKGSQVTIERIEITGNTKTRDKAIRRQLRIYEGELFSGTALRRSREKVTALGYFESVDVTHKPGSDGEHVVVSVEVKEKSTGTFQVGMGFSNVESFIFTAQIAQQNFLGWGQAFSANAQISGLRSFFQLSYFDPYFLDTNLLFSIDLYKTQLDYFGFIRDSYGATASLGYYLIPDEMHLSGGYTYEHVTVEPGSSFTNTVSLYGNFQSGNTSLVKAAWTWDKRDNRLFPSNGFLSFASFETAPNILGGSFNFNRYTAYQRFYHPLPFLGMVFKVNGQVGYIQEHDPTNHPLPSSEMYFLGGISTLRGYPLRTVTPTTLVGSYTSPDASVKPFGIGGNKQFIFNMELEFPLIEKVGIRGVLFYDAGNAFGRDEFIFQDKEHPELLFGMYHSVGFGFRWFSPIGPLRFEWGIPLTKRPGDEDYLFEFTIGNFF